MKIGSRVRSALTKARAALANPRGLLTGIHSGGFSEPPIRGTQEFLEAYETSPWLRAVGDKVATAVSVLNLRLLAPMRDGKAYRVKALQEGPEGMREKEIKRLTRERKVREITEHVFLDALDNPNPFMSRMSLFKVTELHVDFVGDAFWLKARNGLRKPAGYWPIPPYWVWETPTPQRPEFVIRYQSWEAHVPASEIVWFHEPAPAHPYTRGTGVGWALGDEIQVDEYASKMAAAVFLNRARPDWLFMGLGADEKEIRRLERDVTNRLGGMHRNERPYFMAGGEDDVRKHIYQFQRPTMEQLVYPGLRQIQRDIILQTWGTPPELFGILENSNRATIETAEYLFGKWVVLPKSHRLRLALQREFILEFDDRGVVHFDSPVDEDKVHTLNVAKAAPFARTFDEWRELQCLEPVGGPLGASYPVPLTHYLTDDPLDQTKRPKTGPAKPEGGDGGSDDDDKPEKDDKGATVGELLEAAGGRGDVHLHVHGAPITVEGVKMPELPPTPLILRTEVKAGDNHVHLPEVKAEIPDVHVHNQNDIHVPPPRLREMVVQRDATDERKVARVIERELGE